MVKKWYLGLCMILAIGLPALAWADSATASLDRSITSTQESVQLSIHVDGSADQDPDFAVLKQNFELLSQRQNSSYSFINGHMSRSKDWTITLMPKHAGTLPIPPISLGNMMTHALVLKVVDASSQVSQAQNQDVFINMSASSLDSYVQARILITVQLFRAINLSQAELSEPEAKHVMIKRLGKDKNYETMLNQRRYLVTERRYAVFPQQSGDLHIPAVVMSGQINQGIGIFNQAGRVIRVRSKDLDVNVRAMPSDWDASQAWLPARKVTLREIPNDHADLQVGDSLTRTIEIRAHGLTAEQLPPLMSQNVSQGWKQYQDKPELKTEMDADGVVGIRREKIALIPTQAGDLSLPAIRVTWWNTHTNQVEHAEVLSRVVKVKANAHAKPVLQTPIANPQKSQALASLSQASAIAAPNKHLQVGDSQVKVWQGMSAALLVGWLLTLVWLWYGKQQASRLKEEVEREQIRTLKSARKALERVCRVGDAQAVAQQLLLWGEVTLQRHDLRHFSQLKGQSDMLDEALEDLQRHLYSEDSETAWDGMKVWRAVECLDIQEHEPQEIPLPPLL